MFDDDRYWIVEVHYAKADPFDVLMTVSVTNAGPEAETLHVLPTAWFRNTWSWDAGEPKPELAATGDGGGPGSAHPFLGDLELIGGDGPDGSSPPCSSAKTRPTWRGSTAPPRRRRTPRTGSTTTSSPGHATVNPDRRGTKCAFWYQLTLGPGATAELRLRLRPPAGQPERRRAAREPVRSRFLISGGPKPTSFTPN